MPISVRASRSSVPRRQYLSAKTYSLDRKHRLFLHSLLSKQRSQHSEHRQTKRQLIAIRHNGYDTLASEIRAFIPRLAAHSTNIARNTSTSPVYSAQQFAYCKNPSPTPNTSLLTMLFSVHPRPTLLPLQTPLPPPQLPTHPLPRNRYHNANPSQPRRLCRKPRILQHLTLGDPRKRLPRPGRPSASSALRLPSRLRPRQRRRLLPSAKTRKHEERQPQLSPIWRRWRVGR